LGGGDRGGFVRGILRGGFKGVGDLDLFVFMLILEFTLSLALSTTPILFVVEGSTEVDVDGSGTAARFSSTRWALARSARARFMFRLIFYLLTVCVRCKKSFFDSTLFFVSRPANSNLYSTVQYSNLLQSKKRKRSHL